MLPECMYKSLREDKLPKVYPTKSLLELLPHRARTLKRRRDEIRNVAVKLVRPLALVKAVTITGTKFSGYRTVSRNAYICKPGDEVSYQVDVKNQLRRPTVAKLTVAMDEEKQLITVLFMPLAPYSRTLKKKITDPETLRCSATVTSATGFFRYDAVNETYNVGLFDDRYKPAGEYPVAGVDNVVLDIAYSWRITNLVYPTPLPEGLTFDSMSVEFRSGFVVYEGKVYKDPAVNNIIRVGARIKNNTGTAITVKHWGFPLTVLFEDNRRVSQVNVDVTFPDRTINNGQYYSYYLDIPLPTWCYGKVALAHALRVYKAGMPIYFGGPLWQTECFRLRLP